MGAAAGVKWICWPWLPLPTPELTLEQADETMTTRVTPRAARIRA
jgi:hypothetical protein